MDTKNERVLIEKGTERIEKDLALLNWMHSEIDLIEADLPSKRPTAANSIDCLACSTAQLLVPWVDDRHARGSEVPQVTCHHSEAPLQRRGSNQ